MGAFDRPVICYCGGGISATCDAFALVRLGHEDVAVYDGSMNEWVRDPSLPIDEGAEPGGGPRAPPAGQASSRAPATSTGATTTVRSRKVSSRSSTVTGSGERSMSIPYSEK